MLARAPRCPFAASMLIALDLARLAELASRRSHRCGSAAQSDPACWCRNRNTSHLICLLKALETDEVKAPFRPWRPSASASAVFGARSQGQFSISIVAPASATLNSKWTVARIFCRMMLRAAAYLAVLLALTRPAAALRLLPWTPELVADAPWRDTPTHTRRHICCRKTRCSFAVDIVSHQPASRVQPPALLQRCHAVLCAS